MKWRGDESGFVMSVLKGYGVSGLMMLAKVCIGYNIIYIILYYIVCVFKRTYNRESVDIINNLVGL